MNFGQANLMGGASPALYNTIQRRQQQSLIPSAFSEEIRRGDNGRTARELATLDSKTSKDLALINAALQRDLSADQKDIAFGGYDRDMRLSKLAFEKDLSLADKEYEDNAAERDYQLKLTKRQSRYAQELLRMTQSHEIGMSELEFGQDTKRSDKEVEVYREIADTDIRKAQKLSNLGLKEREIKIDQNLKALEKSNELTLKFNANNAEIQSNVYSGLAKTLRSNGYGDRQTKEQLRKTLKEIRDKREVLKESEEALRESIRNEVQLEVDRSSIDLEEKGMPKKKMPSAMAWFIGSGFWVANRIYAKLANRWFSDITNGKVKDPTEITTQEWNSLSIGEKRSLLIGIDEITKAKGNFAKAASILPDTFKKDNKSLSDFINMFQEINQADFINDYVEKSYEGNEEAASIKEELELLKEREEEIMFEIETTDVHSGFFDMIELLEGVAQVKSDQSRLMKQIVGEDTESIINDALEDTKKPEPKIYDL